MQHGLPHGLGRGREDYLGFAWGQKPSAGTNLGFELARLPAGIAQVEPQPRRVGTEYLGFGVLGVEVAAQIEAVEDFRPPFD